MAFTVTHPESPVTDRHAPMAEWCLAHGYTSEIAFRWAADSGQDPLGLELARDVRSLEEARTRHLSVVR